MVQAAAGRDFTVALTEGGRVYTFGLDVGGGKTLAPSHLQQLDIEGIVSVVAGETHCGGLLGGWGDLGDTVECM